LIEIKFLSETDGVPMPISIVRHTTWIVIVKPVRL